MSVEIPEERIIEAPVAIDKETQQERCATLGGAAIACAGCPFVRFCELKAEVEQGSVVENAVGDSTEDIFGLPNLDSLFLEVALVDAPTPNVEEQPEKIITPLPYEVKNTTSNYIDKLMDDKIEVVFANSIIQPDKPSRSDDSSSSSYGLEFTEVEQPVKAVVVTEKPVNNDVLGMPETLVLASEDVKIQEMAPELAYEVKVEPVADHFEITEAIVDEVQPQAEEKIIVTEIITENILRPKEDAVQEVVVAELIQNSEQIEPMVATTFSDFDDSPIFYNGDFHEIIEAAEEPAEVFETIEREVETVFEYLADRADIIEIPENPVETADEAVEDVERVRFMAAPRSEGTPEHIVIQGPEEDALQTERRLAEALLSGNDDIVDPESHLVSRKVTNKLKILRQLALRALMFGA